MIAGRAIEWGDCRLEIDVPLPPPPRLKAHMTGRRWWAVRVDPGGHFGLIQGPFLMAHTAELEATRMRDTAAPQAREVCVFGYLEAPLGTLNAAEVHPVL